MQGSLAEILSHEIQSAARAAVAEIYQPVQVFSSLPEICGIAELAEYYKTSKEVISKMAKAGMPHTHAGREFRFHRSLLIDWTRSGENPFPCQKCLSENQPADTVETEIEADSNPSNITEFSPKAKNRTEKFARMVGNK